MNFTPGGSRKPENGLYKISFVENDVNEIFFRPNIKFNIKFTELAKGAKIGGKLGIVVDARGVWQPR